MTNDAFTSGEMELVLDSDLDSIERVVDEAESFLESRIADDDLTYRVVLLATEAVTNAIEHGNKFDRAKQVFFKIHIHARRVEVLVEDEGVGFDPDKRADPLAAENLLREGGRGILFMESMADEVHFEKGGRRVRLIFHAA